MPDIIDGGALFWSAYWQLCSCRSSDGIIPWDKAQLWADTHKLDGDMGAELHYVVRELDKVWLACRPNKQGAIGKPNKEAPALGHRRNPQR